MNELFIIGLSLILAALLFAAFKEREVKPTYADIKPVHLTNVNDESERIMPGWPKWPDDMPRPMLKPLEPLKKRPPLEPIRPKEERKEMEGFKAKELLQFFEESKKSEYRLVHRPNHKYPILLERIVPAP